MISWNLRDTRVLRRFQIGFGPIMARMLHQSSRHKHGTFAAALMPEKLAEMSCRALGLRFHFLWFVPAFLFEARLDSVHSDRLCPNHRRCFFQNLNSEGFGFFYLSHTNYRYSCNNITTTLIQISRLFYFGFFSKNNHQMII